MSKKGKNCSGKITIGTIASSDHFPSTSNDIKRAKYLSTDCIEMEGASVMKVCWMYNKTCLLVRGISNIAGYNKNKFLAWNKSNRILAEQNAANIVIEIIKNIKN